MTKVLPKDIVAFARSGTLPSKPATRNRLCFSIGPVQQLLYAAVPVAFGEPCGIGGSQCLDQLVGDDLCFAGVEIAGIEEEVAPLHLMVAHDDRWISSRQCGSEAGGG